jgi:hypothetical protein
MEWTNCPSAKALGYYQKKGSSSARSERRAIHRPNFLRSVQAMHGQREDAGERSGADGDHYVLRSRQPK